MTSRPQELGRTANVFEVITDRRSVRQFRPDPVPEPDIQRILDLARYAPNSGNRQPWRFLVVRDRGSIDRLKVKLIERAGLEITELERRLQVVGLKLEGISAYVSSVLSAPLIILVFVDLTTNLGHSDELLYDGALAASNIMLAARALGYGSCFQDIIFAEDIVRGHFSVPEELRFVCAIPIGRPIDWPDLPARKPLKDVVAYETLK